MPLEAGILSKQVESAQKRVEGKNFSIRKHVLQYDDVMNTQREIIYKQRKEVLDGENLKPKILHMIEEVASEIVLTYTQGIEHSHEINKTGLLLDCKNILNIDSIDSLQTEKINSNDIIEEISEKALKKYEQKEEELGDEIRELERIVMLKIVDEKWMNHIDNMDELKDGIGLRAYGQKDPVVQYRMEGFEMFDQMITDIKLDVVKLLMHLAKKENIVRQNKIKITSEGLEGPRVQTVNNNQPAQKTTTVINNEPKVGRNEPCPCGSGKKYKNCCGKNQ